MAASGVELPGHLRLVFQQRFARGGQHLADRLAGRGVGLDGRALLIPLDGVADQDRGAATAPGAEHQRAIALERFDAVQFEHRPEQLAERGAGVEADPFHHGVDGRDVEAVDARLPKKRREAVAEFDLVETAVQPMAPRPCTTVGPDVVEQRKGGKGPRVPRPEIEAIGIHACDLCIRPARQVRLDEAALNEIVAAAAGPIGRRTLGGFVVEKDVRPGGAAVDRRSTELGQPDRLLHRRPRGRLGKLDATATLIMEIGPPFLDGFRPEHPVLAMGAILDRGAQPVLAIVVARIVPVVMFTAVDRGGQSGLVVSAFRTVRIAVIDVLAAPVGERQVIVDADGINFRVGP